MISSTDLNHLLVEQLDQVADVVSAKPGEKGLGLILIPEAEVGDFTMQQMDDLVAKTSNAYANFARLAAIAAAHYKMAKGAFDREFKKAKVGNSEAVRERNAMEACEDLHQEMIRAEAISSLASGLEAAAKVASESARKVYRHVENSLSGEAREGRVIHSEHQPASVQPHSTFGIDPDEF